VADVETKERLMSDADTKPLLELNQCTIRFGGLTAVSEFSMSICEQQLFGLIGPNGAGKTTVFNLITGVYAPTEGQIHFAGNSLAGRKPYGITKCGIARTFQNIRLFPSLTVFDNVRVAFHLRLKHDATHSLTRFRKFREEEAEIAAQTLELLEIFNLGKLRDAPAKSLSYGHPTRIGIMGPRAGK